MSEKSVLIINTPSDCKECDCHLWLVCVPKDEDIEPDENGRYSIPDWCPLRPLPERKDEGSVLKPLPFEVYMYRYGFNECLDEIVGETE